MENTNSMQNNANVLLKITDLEMTYDKKEILHKVSFNVKEGEFLSLLGPSGCGKTTILRILIGLLKPSGGKIELRGEDITCYEPSRRKMGIVFQNYALFENMTVVGNVEYALRCKKGNRSKEARAAIRKRAEELLKQLGLADEMSKKPTELSGGQQQRVAIARTLIMQPDIILFDEPMAALDVATRLALRERIKKIQSDFHTTIIYITHDQEEAFAMSDRIMVMSEGNIEQLDTPENIVNNPANEYVKDFVLKNIEIKINSLIKYQKTI